MNGNRLLADILVWPKEKIEKAILFKDSYSFIPLEKRNGSSRKIYAPSPDLKRFQRRFLKYFLYRIPLDGYCIIRGFRRKFSYVDNAREHAKKGTKFVLRLDLEDAFPSIKTEHLRPILEKIIWSEIERYQEELYQPTPLFPVKKVRWFRKLVKDSPQLNLFADPSKIINEFIELVFSLTTHQGELPQGAPTSPYLLNLVLYYSGLVEKIYRFLWDKRILVSDSPAPDVTGFQVVFTIYADDFTISSSKPIPGSSVNDLIKLIEQELPFKVNRQKVIYFRRKRIAPLVTGLRLTRLTKGAWELEHNLSKDGLLRREIKNIKRQVVNEKGEWIIEIVSLPKKEVRKIRGLINRARFEESLRPKIAGHMACLKAIYGDDLPNQIAVPYQKYLKSLAG